MLLSQPRLCHNRQKQPVCIWHNEGAKKDVNTQIVKYGLVLLATTLLSACGNKPTCGSEDTQALVKEVGIDRFRDVLATRLSPYADRQSYKFFKSQVDNRNIQEIVQKVDTIIENTQFSLQNIRTLNSSEPRQALCAATFSTSGLQNPQLMIHDVSGEITYSVQYSDDGKTLNVKVSGL